MLDLGGTYRAIDPQETMNRLEPLLFEKFGITRVANITGLDNIGIPTYVAIRPLSKLLTTSQGKGINHLLAKISAIMESIEGWHAENLEAASLVGSYNELKKKYSLIDIHNLTIDACLNRYLYDLDIEWLAGHELQTGNKVYFPRSIIDLDMTACRLNSNAKYFTCSSNGLASGNTYNEALCHALFEVIERHAWSEAQLKPLQYIDLNSIESPHIKELLSKIDFKRVSLEVYDASHSLDIPTYVARLTDLSGLHALGTYIGAGTHLSSVVALSRAITEAIQSRLTIISGSRDDRYPSCYKARISNPNRMVTAPETRYPFVETIVPNDFKQCIDATLKRLNKHHFNQVIVYNHTNEALQIPTVHVIVPKMKIDLFKHISIAYMPEQLCDGAFTISKY